MFPVGPHSLDSARNPHRGARWVAAPPALCPVGSRCPPSAKRTLEQEREEKLGLAQPRKGASSQNKETFFGKPNRPQPDPDWQRGGRTGREGAEPSALCPTAVSGRQQLLPLSAPLPQRGLLTHPKWMGNGDLPPG